jgi:heme O synthase-like polyprenyltransferase
VSVVNGLLNPSRQLLIGLIVLFVVLAAIYAFTGILGFIIPLVLVVLLAYFIVLAVREFRRAPAQREQ